MSFDLFLYYRHPVFIGIVNYFASTVKCGNAREGRSNFVVTSGCLIPNLVVVSISTYVYNSTIVIRRVVYPVGIVDRKIAIMFIGIKGRRISSARTFSPDDLFVCDIQFNDPEWAFDV
jgi:hypothetical protein